MVQKDLGQLILVFLFLLQVVVLCTVGKCNYVVVEHTISN